MTPRVRIIGVGQAAAGDDGAGLAVIGALRALGVPADVELFEVSEPSALLPLLSTEAKVIIVDAVLGEPVGQVLELSAHDLGLQHLTSLSAHGLGVAEVLQLASAVWPSASSKPVRLVAIRIAQPRTYRLGLSTEVSDAVRRAAKLIRESVLAR